MYISNMFEDCNFKTLDFFICHKSAYTLFAVSAAKSNVTPDWTTDLIILSLYSLPILKMYLHFFK